MIVYTPDSQMLIIDNTDITLPCTAAKRSFCLLLLLEQKVWGNGVKLVLEECHERAMVSLSDTAVLWSCALEKIGGYMYMFRLLRASLKSVWGRRAIYYNYTF